MIKIVTDYPAAFFIFCLILGIAYASLLYYKNPKEDFSFRLNILLFFLRTFVVAILAFFLLNPLLKVLTKQTEKPLLVFFQDNSKSLLMNPDSNFYKNTYPEMINKFLEKFEQKYDVHTLSFGETVREGVLFSFDDLMTDIGQCFTHMHSTFYNRNVGAVIIASDGLFNVGINPIYAVNNTTYPVYTIAIGDTTVYKDIILEKINYNRIVFLNNRFPVEVVVNARKAIGEKTNLSISVDDKVVHRQTMTIDKEMFSSTYNFMIDADKAGKRKITANLTPVDGEINISNNMASVFVDVIDSRSKILILYNAPHPDIFAIKSGIENNINYEVEHLNINDFSGNVDAYNLVIFHALPSFNTFANEKIKQISNAHVPLLYVIGNQTNILLFNELNTGLKIENFRNSMNESLPFFNNDFALFSIDEKNRHSLQFFPPLYTFFGEYKTMPTAHVLLYQKIGAVVTKQPLTIINDIAGKKVGVVAGEGYWRWRLADYAKNNNHNASNEIISKIVQYLVVRIEKNNFRVIVNDIFYENENIVFDAELYNKSFELINSEDVSLIVKDDVGKTYNYAFSKTSNAYRVDIGKLPAGNYTYDARVSVGNNIFNDFGAFTVAPLNIEALYTIADHTLLSNLSVKTNAKMYYPKELEELHKNIVENDDIKPLIYEKIDLSELLNMYWILFLIVLLLGLEWFLRKWSGSY